MSKKMVLIPYERYERLLKNVDEPCVTSDGDHTSDDLGGLKDDIVLAMLPKHLQTRAIALLSALNGCVKLNEQGELIDSDNSCIEGSHITDLIRATLYNYKHGHRFTGLDDFCRILAFRNIPLSLCTNVDIRARVQRLKADKKPERTTKTWISL